MKRVMCVHFPDWPLQRIQQARPELRALPFVLTRPHAGKGSKVSACCERAQRGGVRPGMPAAEALATLPTLTLVDEDLDADRAMLLRLAQWSERYSPIVGVEETLAPSCLYVDVTGGVDCFGGEDTLLRRVRDEFRADGWRVQVALADTLGGAWALAHFPPLPLGRLPITALRLPSTAVALLGQLGIERVEQLAELPRSEVAVRFGSAVLMRLDQAIGGRAEVIEPYHAQPDAEASMRFEYPVEHWHVLTTAANQLLVRLEAMLEKRGQGTRLLQCVLYMDLPKPRGEVLRTPGIPELSQGFGVPHPWASHVIECSLSRPMRSAIYLGKLLGTHLEKVRLAAPVQGIRVRALVTERILDEQPGLFEGGQDADRESWSQLLDSLVSRLGDDVVTAVQLVSDPQPELACRFAPALQQVPPSSSGRGENRPLRLFPRPVPVEVIALVPDGTPMRLLFADGEHVVQGMRGPERIETGWWRDADIHRDYFVVDTADGTRWWVFRRLEDGRWFLHGCFD